MDMEQSAQNREAIVRLIRNGDMDEHLGTLAREVRQRAVQLTTPDDSPEGMMQQIEQIQAQLDAIMCEPQGIRNKHGIELHGKIQKIKTNLDALERRDPVAAKEVAVALKSTVDSLLRDVFKL